MTIRTYMKLIKPIKPIHVRVMSKLFACCVICSYAQTLIVVVLIVVNFFVFLVIAPYPTMRF